jgi:transposase-like protein
VKVRNAGRIRRPSSQDWLEAVRDVKTINEIAQEHNVHPQFVTQWKKEILENSSALFEAKRAPKPVEESSPEDKLYSEIGRLKIETDWLKKSWVCTSGRAHGLDRARTYGSAVDAPV